MIKITAAAVSYDSQPTGLLYDHPASPSWACLSLATMYSYVFSATAHN